MNYQQILAISYVFNLMNIFINNPNHKVLESVHPSPLSAHRGFLGCKHFSQANAWLTKHRRTPIDWAL